LAAPQTQARKQPDADPAMETRSPLQDVLAVRIGAVLLTLGCFWSCRS